MKKVVKEGENNWNWVKDQSLRKRIMECCENERYLQRLPREFFTRDGLTLAKELLGKVLVHETEYGIIRGMITETEGYMGMNDKGSHTYQGRRTNRTEPMYHIGGTSYVYFTYGMYYCMNITAQVVDVAQAALLRSVVPLDLTSYEIMKELRLQRTMDRKKYEDKKENKEVISKLEKQIDKNLSDGPAKLCIAMGITKENNDIDLVTCKDFYVTEGIDVLPEEIKCGKRIGIDYAEEAADYLWRFFL